MDYEDESESMMKDDDALGDLCMLTLFFTFLLKH